jgi:hypothetical protein
MNDEVEVTIFQAMIEWILQLTLVVTNSHLSVEIHCLKVMFSIAISVNKSNVFSKSIGPGHSLQSWKKQFVWGGLQITFQRQCWYTEGWCSLLLVVQIFRRLPTLTSHFGELYIHTHTVCTTCTCHNTVSGTQGCELRKTYFDSWMWISKMRV